MQALFKNHKPSNGSDLPLPGNFLSSYNNSKLNFK
jgi:hypothetical protein